MNTPCNHPARCGVTLHRVGSAAARNYGGRGAATRSTLPLQAPPSAAPSIIITDLVPRQEELAGYYAATDAKHFSRGTAGSTFTDPTLVRVEDVVGLALAQRGTLDGDDRELLVAVGGPREAFSEECRYLLVRTPGVVGVLNSDSLDAETVVEVVRMKPDTPCSLVIEVDTQPTSELATLILGPDTEGTEIVYTVHPGVPCVTDNEDRARALENQQVPLERIRALYQGEVWLNTVLPST